MAKGNARTGLSPLADIERLVPSASVTPSPPGTFSPRGTPEGPDLPWFNVEGAALLPFRDVALRVADRAVARISVSSASSPLLGRDALSPDLLLGIAARSAPAAGIFAAAAVTVEVEVCLPVPTTPLRRVRDVDPRPDGIGPRTFFAREGCRAGLRDLSSFEEEGSCTSDTVLPRLRWGAGASSGGDPARFTEVRIGESRPSWSFENEDEGVWGRSATGASARASLGKSEAAGEAGALLCFRGDSCESVR